MDAQNEYDDYWKNGSYTDAYELSYDINNFYIDSYFDDEGDLQNNCSVGEGDVLIYNGRLQSPGTGSSLCSQWSA